MVTMSNILDPIKDPIIGTLIADKYRILEMTGAGNCAAVYRAEDLQQPGRDVAVKLLHENLVSEPRMVLRFQQEAEALAMLNHPNIVRIEDYGIADSSQPFLVTEFIHGTSVEQELAQRSRMSLTETLEIARQCCALLNYAEDQGIIHRDLKPANIMLQHDQKQKLVVKLVDFGFSKLVNPDGHSLINLTVSGVTVGTPQYMSPEQCLGRKLDGRSDVYGLACVVYEMLAGQPALGASTALGCMGKHLEEYPPSFKEVDDNLQVPENVEAAIFRALSKDPAERFTALQFARALSGQAPDGQSVLIFLRGVFKFGKPDRRRK